MRIPSDINIPVTAPRSGVLEALGLRVGEAVTARVVAQNPNGSTLVQIGNQQVSLNLPVDAEIGQILQFEVKTAGAQPQLSLVATLPKPGAPTTQPQNLLDAVAVKVETSAPPPQQSPAQAAYSRPINAPQPATPGISTGVNPAPTAPQAPIPVPPNISAALSLQPGQVLNVRVASPGASGQPNIVINGQSIPVPPQGAPASPPLTPGSILQVQVQQQNGLTVLLVQTQRAEPKLYPNLVQQTGTPAASSNATSPQTSPGQTISQPGQAPMAPGQAAALAGQALPPPNLSQVAAQAVAGQDSVGRLIASIAGLKGAEAALPPEIAKLASQISKLSINLDERGPDAQILRAAVAASGVLLEANLAQALPPTQQGDMKGLLLLLRNALGNWLGNEVLPRPPDQRPAPPMRGAPPRADGSQPQSLPPGLEGKDLGKHLLSQTDAALSRVRLFQLASLPEAGQRGSQAATQELHFELPFTLGNQTRIAQFQVNRDGGQDGTEASRGWNIVFAVHFNVVGAVGAKISMRARKTGIAIWAENEETVEVLETMLPELVSGLETLGLELASVRVRHHPPQSQPVATGGFMDSVS